MRIYKNREVNKYIADLEVLFEKTNKTIEELTLENLDESRNKVGWGIIYDSYLRTLDYTKATIFLIKNSHVSSAEAHCRTSIEGSVNLHYFCSDENYVNKIVSYFKNHLETERKQNKTWLQAVNSSSHIIAPVKSVHINKINDKEESLDSYDEMLRDYFNPHQVNYDDINIPWPSIFERFKIIGKELNYRTTYAALCSQSHNDPEDSLNNLTVMMNSDNKVFAEGIEIEKYFFSITMVFLALHMFIDSTVKYVELFDIDKEKQLVKNLHELEEQTIEFSTFKNSFLFNFSKNF